MSANSAPTSTYRRTLSAVERLWIVANRLRPPFCNQAVLEGDGEIDGKRWRAALETVTKAHPGTCLVLRGSLGKSHWVPESPPPLREVDGSKWDGRSPQGAPFLDVPLSPHTGPTCEVVVAHGSPTRVAFRSHHAAMDGRGTLVWAQDLFRALRGEPLLGSGSELTDMDLARSLDAGVNPVRREDCIAPTGGTRGYEQGTTWRRVTLPGRHSKLLPRTAIALAAMARSVPGQQGGIVRFDIPVDMRFRRAGLASTANLTGMIHLPVAEGDTAEDLARDLTRQVAERREASFGLEMNVLGGIPLGLMTWLGKLGVQRCHRRCRYISSGVLSNLGRLPLETCEGGGFRPFTGFFIPPASDSNPFFLTLAGGVPDGEPAVELAAALPVSLATDARLERALDQLVATLTA